MKPKKIGVLILYAELMGYNRATFDELLMNYCIDLYVICWDKNTVSEYKETLPINFKLYYRSEFKTAKSIISKFANKNIELVMASGWMDKIYLSVCKYYKENGKLTICTLDTQWRNTLRQNLGRVWARLFVKPVFTHAFVAGIYQYEFARKIGFSKNDIKIGCYSADTKLFERNNVEKERILPKKILFIGRFVETKGIKLLINVYLSLPLEIRNEWSLTLIGNGDLTIGNHENIEIKSFMQPKELAAEVRKYGLFCLPSYYEPWGVVIHEMVCAGLPIICSSECGANSVFLKNNFNGLEFKAGNMEDFREKLIHLCSLSNDELQRMSQNSKSLSKQLNPTLWAATLMSFLRFNQ